MAMGWGLSEIRVKKEIRYLYGKYH